MDSAVDTRQTDPHVNPGLSTQEKSWSRAPMNGSRMLMSRSPARMKNSHAFNEQISRLEKKPVEQASSAIARQAGATRLDRPAVDSGHLYRCFRLAVLWRDGQADDLPVGTATGFVVAVGNTEACRPAEPACRSGGRGGRSSFAIVTSGSDRAARGGSRPDPSRGDTVAPNDGARSRKRAAGDRAAQGQPGRIGPRKCWDRRAAQGEPGANGARDLQRLRAEPAARGHQRRHR